MIRSEPLLLAARLGAIALFLILWVIVSREDWRRQKIRGRWLKRGVWGASAGYGLLLATTVLGLLGRVDGSYFSWGYYQAAAVHALFCAAAALALWWLAVWPAGDAKLFMLLGVLYPLLSSAPFDRDRAFFSALVNIFLPAAAFLTARAGWHLLEHRLRSRRGFLIELGWRRELDFYGGRLAALAREAAAKARLPGAVRDLARGALTWIVGGGLSALAIASIPRLASSALLSSGASASLFLLWEKARRAWGFPAALALAGASAGALVWWGRPDIGRYVATLWRMSLFGLFLSLGMAWTSRVLAGELGLLPPILAPAFGFVLMRLGGWFVPGAFGGPLGVWSLLAALGVLFGLSLAMIRVWDDHDRRMQDVLGIEAFALPHPSFMEKVREDEPFYSAYFRSLYADGLTSEQAEALKAWCLERGIAEIPLKATISFAFWIFLGFFLCRLLGGRSVLELLL